MLTAHVLYLLKQSTQPQILNAWLGLKRYCLSTILSQFPQEQADPEIRLNEGAWMRACLRVLTLLANFKGITDNYFLPASWKQAAGW